MATKSGNLNTANTDFITLSGGVNVDAATPAVSPLNLNGDTEVTYTVSGSYTGAGVQAWLKTPGGTWVPVGVVDQQTNAFIPAGTISPADGKTKTWVVVFPPGSWIDAKLSLASITSGPVVVELNSGKSPAGSGQTVLVSASTTSATLTEVNTAISTVGNGTLTAAAIAGGVITRTGPTANFTDTTATAAQIIAALSSAVVGQSWELTIVNATAWQQTLSAGTGVTLSGTTALPANTWVRYLATYSGSGAVTIASIATGSTVAATAPNTVANFRNLIDGGDFSVNPWQRNIPGLATANVITTPIANTVTYFPDRWFAVGGASSAVLLAQVADTSVAGFSTSCKVQRQAANANAAVISFGHVLETLDSIRAQGQQVTFSFWAKAGANFSAAGSNVTVQVISGTGANQAAANMVAATWTGQTNVVNTTQALATTMSRYQFTGTVPAGCTQLGVLLSFTPVGTAGADDSITVNGLQLEIGPAATAFEHRDVQVELEICQRYAWVVPEPANGVVVGTGTTLGANAQTFYMATPVQLYKAPALTVVTGGFKVAAGAAFATATITAGSTHTPNAISVNATVTAAAGIGALLGGGGGSGYVLASSDF